MKKFDVKVLLDTAQQRTNLSDFGPDDYLEGLEIFIASLNRESHVAEDRWDIAFEYFVRILNNRLWFAQDLKANPQILDQELLPPVAIIPMPRTGSTKVQRMLGAGDDFQNLLWWQMFMFARIPGLPDGGAAERLAQTKTYEAWTFKASPNIGLGHPMYAEEPEEEVNLNEFSFRTSKLAARFHVPDYTAWLMSADQQPTYDYMIAQLKYLQWQFNKGAAKPWLLKSPGNVGNEANLVKLFGPGMKFIYTHRDPANIIGSVATTFDYSRKLFSDHDYSADTMAMVTALYTISAARSMAWRDANPGVETLDLSFKRINADTPGTLKAIYDFIGLDLTPDVEAKILGWEQDKSKNKFKKNVYDVEGGAIGPAEIRSRFADYIQRYRDYIPELADASAPA